MFGIFYSLLAGGALLAEDIKNTHEDYVSKEKAFKNCSLTYSDHKCRDRLVSNNRQVYTSLDGEIRDLKNDKVYYSYKDANYNRIVSEANQKNHTVLYEYELDKFNKYRLDGFSKRNHVLDIETNEVFKKITIYEYKHILLEPPYSKSYSVYIDKNYKIIRIQDEYSNDIDTVTDFNNRKDELQDIVYKCAEIYNNNSENFDTFFENGYRDSVQKAIDCHNNISYG